MKEHKNIFGKGILYDETDLKGNIYATSAACMSVWSDLLSWANNTVNKDRFVNDPKNADSIIVLGCQVTDLSILNDIKIAEKLYKETRKEIFMGGCLAQRFDIELPNFIKRLDVVRLVGQPIYNRNLINYEPPFWVKNFEKTDELLKEGNLFRNFYPLKIGAGCHGKCKYCTITQTRGDNYEVIPENQEQEFLKFDNIVLISDSPTVSQIKGWCELAIKHNKEISIRNIEPTVLVRCAKEVINISEKGLLKILHCPVQSFDDEILKIMNRDPKFMWGALEVIKEVRKHGTLTATNIIIDYVYDGKTYPNYNKEMLEKYFDYYSWNPYFDGKFDMKKAEERWEKYIIKGVE